MKISGCWGMVCSLVLLLASCQTMPAGDEPPPLGQRQQAVTVTPLPLLPGDLAAGDRLGVAVSLSNDGKTALVGALYNATSGGPLGGAAYIFERSGSGWAQTQKLQPDDLVMSDRFGGAVKLSADGNVALVGAPQKGIIGKCTCGAAYVFTRSNGTWIQQQQLTAPDGFDQDDFGGALASSADGSTLLVGAPGKNQGNGFNFTGKVYAYARDAGGGGWALQQALEPLDLMPGDTFGYSGALSADGSRALLCSLGRSGPNNAALTGVAYVFARAGSTWTQEATLNNPNPVMMDRFGESSDLSGDGSQALIGVTGVSSDGVISHGAVVAFTRQGSTWTESQVFSPKVEVMSGLFGTSVSITPDGAHAVIGARALDSGTSGVSYLFDLVAGVWSEQRQLLPDGAAPGDEIGSSVSISSNARVALVGAQSKAQGGKSQSGAAFVFELKQDAGEACATGDDCTTGSCVAGVCCELPCGAGAAGGMGGDGGGGGPGGQAGQSGSSNGGADPGGAGGQDAGSGPAGGTGGAAAAVGGQGGSAGDGGSAGKGGAGAGGSAGKGGSGAAAGKGGSGGSAGKGGSGAASGKGGSGAGGTGKGGAAGTFGASGSAGKVPSGSAGMTGSEPAAAPGTPADSAGCGCRATGAPASNALSPAALLALALLAARVQARRR